MAPSKRMDLILASASPRRKSILRQHGYRFRIIPSQVRETQPRGLSPLRLVRHLALKKAVAIARRNVEAVVLGADTLVYINGHVIGKPRDPEHAERILRELSGAWQRVYTGVAIVTAGGQRRFLGAAVSHVKFRRLSEAEIKRASRRNLDKAGGYAVQRKRDRVVERIRGDYDNVVGLPMRQVKRLLRRAREALSKTV